MLHDYNLQYTSFPAPLDHRFPPESSQQELPIYQCNRCIRHIPSTLARPAIVNSLTGPNRPNKPPSNAAVTSNIRPILRRDSHAILRTVTAPNMAAASILPPSRNASTSLDSTPAVTVVSRSQEIRPKDDGDERGREESLDCEAGGERNAPDKHRRSCCSCCSNSAEWIVDCGASSGMQSVMKRLGGRAKNTRKAEIDVQSGVGAGIVGCGGLQNMGRRRKEKGTRKANSVGSHGSSEAENNDIQGITIQRRDQGIR
ncbi:hypothetical protein DFH94DRAFT_847424 [Russula ochroleuca]|uniref:Uncharacterized protein n=1 Tax=Russula ochroleuca TaxID=152965 RepID=A0A9P5JZV4_9AGAM|nr:hypothetical protein DFH94DRAFT_847424 [Russula ochroleuca]